MEEGGDWEEEEMDVSVPMTQGIRLVCIRFSRSQSLRVQRLD